MNLARRHLARPLGFVIIAIAGTVAACSGSPSTTTSNANATATSRAATNAAAATSPAATNAATESPATVLPVTRNPIVNTATAPILQIDSVLVENNVDPATHKAVDDHLEIALTNTGTTMLGQFEVFYTFDDPTAKAAESYYFKFPDSFTIDAGATRVAHFDDTGAPDHFPTNEFSLYRTSPNAMDVTVTVSATGAAVRTTTVQKDAGGPEEAD